MIKDEAKKNARFAWHQGWERSSGYIKTELRGDSRFGVCRLYHEWKKKKEPTEEQVALAAESLVDSLLANEQHHQTQRDFRHYLLETYYVDLYKMKEDAMLHILDSLTPLIKILEQSEQFTEMPIQGLHNALKNLDAAVSDHEAVECFVDRGRKRVGE